MNEPPVDPRVDEALSEAQAGKMTESRPVAAERITIIGMGDGSKIPPGTEAVTLGAHLPNVVIENVVKPSVAIAVRAANLFLVSLSGFLTTAMAVAVLPPGGNPVLAGIHALTFYQFLATAASFAIAPTVVGLIKDGITVLSGIEKKFPLASGSV